MLEFTVMKYDYERFDLRMTPSERQALEKLAEKAEGEYYLFELMDMQVIEGGKVKGRVIDFILSGTNLVLVLEMEGKEILVPFVKEYIKSVNTDSREMVVEIPSDLKELNQ